VSTYNVTRFIAVMLQILTMARILAGCRDFSQHGRSALDRAGLTVESGCHPTLAVALDTSSSKTPPSVNSVSNLLRSATKR
jgi:hypothetical protein